MTCHYRFCHKVMIIAFLKKKEESFSICKYCLTKVLFHFPNVSLLTYMFPTLISLKCFICGSPQKAV